MSTTGHQENPVKIAADTFSAFIGELTSLSASTFAGIKTANTIHNWGSKLGIHQRGERDTAAQFQHMRSLILIALLGTFESFFEDYGIGVLGRTHGDAEAARLYKTHTTKNCPKGSLKYEVFLERFDRGGVLPPRLRSAIEDSIDVRNVWAHNAGRADRQYITKHPASGLSVGDRVGLSVDQFIAALQAFALYAVVMISRDEVALGRAPIPAAQFSGNQFGDEYAALYPGA